MRATTGRRCALVAAALAWWWASSVFTPWAGDMAHRLWLYDVLFYARFALLAWGVAELGYAVVRWRAGERRIAWALVLCGIVVVGWAYERTDIGLRFKVRASEAALSRSASMPYDTPRHRAGHVIVDTVREPVPGQPWLWLGRPFGGGTGTGRALVRSGDHAPTSPTHGRYAYRRIAGPWWMAEQR